MGVTVLVMPLWSPQSNGGAPGNLYAYDLEDPAPQWSPPRVGGNTQGVAAGTFTIV
jgi:hypothetical protein